MKFFDWLVKFLGETKNALKGYINFEELWKSVLAALTATGGIVGILTVFQDNLSNIITDPVILLDIQHLISNGISKNYVALAVGIVSLGVELYRRYNQGAIIGDEPPVQGTK